MFSTILDWEYDASLMHELVDPLRAFLSDNPWAQVPNRPGCQMKQCEPEPQWDRKYMNQNIHRLVEFYECEEELLSNVLKATPLPLDPSNNHAVAIEGINPGKKVPLHIDHKMGWQNPMTRHANVLFNIMDTPVLIQHKDPAHNKMLHPQQVMILDTTKLHGAAVNELDEEFLFYTVNLRMEYSDTVQYFKYLLANNYQHTY